MINASRCHFPAPSTNFTNEGYSGMWYEIAKYQTAGGGYFEKDCVCTELNVFTEGKDYKVDNICRYKTPDGKVTEAVATLNPSGTSGHFKESFSVFAPSVDYTII